jgi:hypothetical protein
VHYILFFAEGVHHISLILCVMAGRTLIATILIFCEWVLRTLVRHTTDSTHFLVPEFGEVVGKFQVNVLQLILGFCSLRLRKLLGLVSFSFQTCIISNKHVHCMFKFCCWNLRLGTFSALFTYLIQFINYLFLFFLLSLDLCLPTHSRFRGYCCTSSHSVTHAHLVGLWD